MLLCTVMVVWNMAQFHCHRYRLWCGWLRNCHIIDRVILNAVTVLSPTLDGLYPCCGTCRETLILTHWHAICMCVCIRKNEILKSCDLD